MASLPDGNGSEQATTAISGTTAPVRAVPGETRRKKGMSIGNAASLFGAPSPEDGLEGNGAGVEIAGAGSASPLDFFGQLAGGSEEPKQGGASKNAITAVAEVSEEEENTANLFGDTGQDWLGTSITDSAGGDQTGYSGYEGQPPLNETQQIYGYDQQQQQAAYGQPTNGVIDSSSQYASYDQSQYPQQQQSSGYYDPSQQQQQQQYEPPQQPQSYSGYAYPGQNGFQPSQSAYYANQQQQEQPYHSQAQPQSAYSYSPQLQQQQQEQVYQPQAQPQTAYSYSPQLQQQQQEQVYQPQAQPQTAYSYSPQLQQQQASFQTPFSAPASSAFSNTMSQSLNKSGTSAPTYAALYSQAYDPYAPDPSSSTPNQGYSNTVGHPASFQSQGSTHYANSPHPGLQHSQTMNTFPQASSSSSLSQSEGPPKKAKLLRSATSSFFAELPPLPASKSRPASAMGQTLRGSAPLNAFSLPFGTPPLQSSTPPPPPKSRTPVPENTAMAHLRPQQSISELRRTSLEQQAYQTQDFSSPNSTYANIAPGTKEAHANVGRELHYEQPGQKPYQTMSGDQSYSQQPPYTKAAQHTSTHHALHPPMPQHQTNDVSNQALPLQQASVQQRPLQRPPSKQQNPSSFPINSSAFLPTQPTLLHETSQVNEYDGANAENAFAEEGDMKLAVEGLIPGTETKVDDLANESEKSANFAKQEELEPETEILAVHPAIKQEDEAKMPPSASIATHHEQVDSLPLLIDEVNIPDIRMHLEPFERSITLDAYLPPSPKFSTEDPLSIPFLSVSSPSPSPSASPEIKSRIANINVKQEEEDFSFSLDERRAEIQLERAEEILGKDSVTNAYSSTDPSTWQETKTEGYVPQSESMVEPYASAYKPYDSSASDLYSSQQEPPNHLPEHFRDEHSGYTEESYGAYDEQGYYGPSPTQDYSQDLYTSEDQSGILDNSVSQPYEHFGEVSNGNEHATQPLDSSYNPYAAESAYDYGQQQNTYGQMQQQQPSSSDGTFPAPQLAYPHDQAEQDPYNTHAMTQQQGYQPMNTENALYDPYGAPLAQQLQASQYYDPNVQTHSAYNQPEQQLLQAYPPTIESQQPYDPYALSTNRQYTASPASHLTNGHASDPRSSRPPVPIATFGFGGRLVTFFPSSSSFPSASSIGMPYENAVSSSPSAAVIIRKISSLLPSDTAVLESFPGPLFMDSAAINGAGKAKKKKEVLAWLDDRIEECEKESAYAGAAGKGSGRREVDEKTILLRLVSILIDNEGKLSGSSKIDDAITKALVPQLFSANPVAVTMSSAGDSLQGAMQSTSSSYNRATSVSAKANDLDAIQSYLLRGDKREAVRYALDHMLWAHALVISAGVDKDLQASVTREFIQSELASHSGGVTGREPLKVAYSLLSGAGASSIQEFIPPRSLLAQQGPTQSFTSLSAAAPYDPASRSPTPASMDYRSDISPDVLDKWRETAAMIVANRTSGDSQALMNLGDALAANGWLKAAHACYLLSPHSSALGGPSLSGIRYTLLGAALLPQQPMSARDMSAIFLTEIVEFALSFVPVAKGQEAYVGLPHLQAYRSVHALELSDLGLHTQAQKYCDAIGSTLKLATKASPFYHPPLLAQVKELSDRLSLVGFHDRSDSWIARKVPRPTLDNVWSTLEGRFAKFVAGEAEEKPAEVAKRKQAEDAVRVAAGPFAHYSSITPQGTDSISRNASSTDLSRGTPPLQATSVPSTVTKNAGKTATHHRRSSSYGYGPYGADPYPPYVPQMGNSIGEEGEQQQQNSMAPASQLSYDAGYGQVDYGYVTPQNDTGWWSSTTNNDGPQESPYDGSNNTAGYNQGYGQPPLFSPVAEGYVAEDSNGLMSPMNFDNTSFGSFNQTNTLTAPSSDARSPATIAKDDDELGLGNASAKTKNQRLTSSEGPSSRKPGVVDSAQAGPGAGKKVNEEKTLKPTASSSWLGRIFRRDGGSPTPAVGSGAIKAKLGEETSFVYDPVEKRWVNKKAGSETPPPASIVPPPRAQTASPTAAPHSYASQAFTPPPIANSSSVSAGIGATPPPPRSAIIATPPLPPSASSTPPPPSGSETQMPPVSTSHLRSGETPLPPKRPTTATGGASRKNVRARYVDVLAQQQS